MIVGFCRVVGDSMQPTIGADAYVAYADLKLFGLPVGRIYVFRHAELGLMVKRLRAKRRRIYFCRRQSV